MVLAFHARVVTQRRVAASGRGGALTITCESGLNSYDHKRYHAARMGEGPALDGQAPIWDFVVTQHNGTRVRFPQTKLTTG